MTQEAEQSADYVAVLPSGCLICQAAYEADWMAQIHYRTILGEAGPMAALEAFNEDHADEHAEHSDGSGRE